MIQTHFDKKGNIRDDKGRFVKHQHYSHNTEFTHDSTVGSNNSMYGIISPMKNKHHTEEVKRKLSKKLRGKNATSGSFKKGHFVPQEWRDAISESSYKGENPVYRLLYGKLYKIWSYPIFKRDDFRCQECGKTGIPLEAHHDKEKLSEIILRFAPNEKDLSLEEKKMIRNQIIKYHTDGYVSGITLCKSCHKMRENHMKDGTGS